MLEQTFSGRDVHTRNMSQYNTVMTLARRHKMLSLSARESLAVWGWKLNTRFTGLTAADLPLDYLSMADNIKKAMTQMGHGTAPTSNAISLYDVLMKFIDSEGKVSGAMGALLRTPDYNRRLHIRFNEDLNVKIGGTAQKGFFQQARIGASKNDSITLAPGLLMIVGTHRSGKTTMLSKLKISEVMTHIVNEEDKFDAWMLHTDRVIPDNIKELKDLALANNPAEVTTARNKLIANGQKALVDLYDTMASNLLRLEPHLYISENAIGLEGELNTSIPYRLAMNEPDAICSGLPSEASILLSLVEGLEDLKPRVNTEEVARTFAIDSLTSLHETSKGVIKTKGLNYGIMPYIDELVQLAMWKPMVATMSFEENELDTFVQKLKGRVPNIIVLGAGRATLLTRGSVPYSKFKEDLEIEMIPLDSKQQISFMKGVY